MGVQLPVDTLVLLVGAMLALGVLVAGYADRLRAPAPLLFLVLGMVVSDDGLAIVTLSEYGLAQAVGSLALIVILFHGGLTTKPTDLRRAALPGFVLATVGVVLTAGVVALGAGLLLGVGWPTAFLLGAVVSSTDAAAVFAVLRRTPLPRRLLALLEVESGSNDPLAIMLTVGILASMAQPAGVADWVVFGVRQLAGGLVVGWLVGRASAWLLANARLSNQGLYPVLAFATAGVAYGAAAAVGASGFLSVYVAGLLVGALVPRHRRGIRSFHDGLSNTAEIGLFLLLGILVFPSRVMDVAVGGLAVTAILVLLARPVAVHACLWPLRYSWADRHLVTWAGLRGAVPIVLAIFPLTAGHPQGTLIFDVVFFVVLVSVAVQGVTVGPFARWLGLDADASVWTSVAEAVPLDGVDADLVEVDVTDDLFVAGMQLRDAPLPHGGLLTAVVRGRHTLIPTGTTRIEPGDLLLVTMPRQRDAPARVVAWARGELTGSHASRERTAQQSTEVGGEDGDAPTESDSDRPDRVRE